MRQVYNVVQVSGLEQSQLSVHNECCNRVIEYVVWFLPPYSISRQWLF